MLADLPDTAFLLLLQLLPLLLQPYCLVVQTWQYGVRSVDGL
jgi:hypothetical protein